MRDITEVMQILKDIRRNKAISVQQVADYIYEEVGTQISTKTVYGWENALNILVRQSRQSSVARATCPD